MAHSYPPAQTKWAGPALRISRKNVSRRHTPLLHIKESSLESGMPGLHPIGPVYTAFASPGCQRRTHSHSTALFSPGPQSIPNSPRRSNASVEYAHAPSHFIGRLVDSINPIIPWPLSQTPSKADHHSVTIGRYPDSTGAASESVSVLRPLTGRTDRFSTSVDHPRKA
ncbi:unnamed protein product [Penicillium manginii]